MDSSARNENSNPVDAVTLEEVIVVKVLVGNGTQKSPYTLIKQYWTKNGELIGQTRV